MDRCRHCCQRVSRLCSVKAKPTVDRQLQPRKLIRALTYFLGCSTFAFCCSSVFGEETVATRLTGHIEISDLPKGVERKLAAGSSRAELSGMLKEQPTVILDNATLDITPPAVGSSRS